MIKKKKKKKNDRFSCFCHFFFVLYIWFKINLCYNSFNLLLAPGEFASGVFCLAFIKPRPARFSTLFWVKANIPNHHKSSPNFLRLLQLILGGNNKVNQFFYRFPQQVLSERSFFFRCHHKSKCLKIMPQI